MLTLNVHNLTVGFIKQVRNLVVERYRRGEAHKRISKTLNIMEAFSGAHADGPLLMTSPVNFLSQNLIYFCLHIMTWYRYQDRVLVILAKK